MFEYLLSLNKELKIEDEGISTEFTEIGCMCEKCDCNKLAHIAVSICESRLSSNHSGKIDIPFSA